MPRRTRPGGWRAWPRARAASRGARHRRLPGPPPAPLGPATRLLDVPCLPGGFGEEKVGRADPTRLLLGLEEPARGLPFAQRSLDVAGHAVALGEKHSRFALESSALAGLGVRQKVQRDLRDPDRVLRAEGVEGLLHELQPVGDGLLGIVGLREVMHEIGVDAFEPAGVAMFDELGVLAMERPAPAARERGIEHVAHDAAREGQPVAAGLAILLEHSLAEQAVDVVVETRDAFGERLEILRVEGLPQNRGDGEQVPKLLGKALDALLDGLLDGCGERFRRDLRLRGEAPGARVVLSDPARLDQRANELAGEEGVALGGLAQAEGQGVGDVRRADERFDERPVLRGRERRQRDRHESRVVGEGVQHLDEGVALVGLGLAVAAHDQRRRRTEAPDDVLEGLDRGLGAVEVVEDQDERLAAPDPRQRPRDELEDLEAVLRLALLRRGGDAGVAADRRAELGDLRELRKECRGDPPRGRRSRDRRRTHPGRGSGRRPRSARRSPGTRTLGPARRNAHRAPGSCGRWRGS